MIRTSLLAALAVSLAGGALAGASDSVPASGRLTFDVIRKGKDIGDQVIRFEQKGEAVAVSLETDVKVKVPILGMNAYVFRQSSRETWQGNRLVALQSATNDNGKDQAIRLGPSAVLPASLWNADIVKASKLVNTIDGKTMAVTVQSLGAETVTTASGAVPATHYRVGGELERDLWFDADSRLVHVAFTAEDGSRIDYTLR